MSLLGDIARRYQEKEDERLYRRAGGASGGLPFLFGSKGDNRSQRDELSDILTGKKERRKKKERKAGEAIAKYFGLG